jgi:hypothetical protein
LGCDTLIQGKHPYGINSNAEGLGQRAQAILHPALAVFIALALAAIAIHPT